MHKFSNRFLSMLALTTTLCVTGPVVMAQETTEEGASEERVLDTVQVQGVQNDAAMAAFRAGDYETAEVEFLDNAMCALRRERNLTNSQPITGLAAGDAVAARNIQNTYDRTCEMRGRQLYFAGLSQIQLGKTDEALRSFEKATVASKILYDAHYKIGLIKLLSGDTRTAKSELKKLDGILKRCRNCEAKQEIVDRRDHLSKAISGDVSLQ